MSTFLRPTPEYQSKEKIKMEHAAYDISDLVNDLHIRLKNQPQLLLDCIYVDEVQDISLKQISLFQYICKDVDKGIVLSGDTAQTATGQISGAENALITIFGRSESTGAFGAEQSILVRDESAKKEVFAIIGKKALILTMAESKGLEFQIVEHHVPDRVMRQFDRSQHIPAFLTWAPAHCEHDERRRLVQPFLDMLDVFLDDWDNQKDKRVEEVDGVSRTEYNELFQRYGRLLIGNPGLRVIGTPRFTHLAGAHETMSKGLHRLHQIRYEWQQHDASALKIGDKPIQDVEGDRHLTYNDAICIGDYITDMP
ncbi:hypothetical protein HAX54_019781, partial [Datura stramonium]|nr:hypothetical protein [Datura stramonium]